MGGENLHEIQFDDCELPLENLVVRDDGFAGCCPAFNTQRCLNPSISLGFGRRGVRRGGDLCARSHHVRPSDRRISGIRWKLADMFKDIEAARGCCTGHVDRQSFPDPFMAAVRRFLQRNVYAGYD